MTYDPTTIDAPRLSGPILRMTATLMERSVLGKIPAAVFFRRIGMPRFRARHYDEAPLYYPVHPGDAAVPRAPYDTTGRQSDGTGDALPHDGDVNHPCLREGPRTEPAFPSAIDYSRAYREGRLTPTTVAEGIIRTIRTTDQGPSPLCFFIAWNVDEIRRQAEESTRRITNGTARSLFEGVPVAIKDEIDMRGHPTTLGTRFRTTPIATRDAFLVQRLREAGAILLGKTNMHEIGIGVTGCNPFYGTPLNPYAPDRCPGGSSSGSAAAVAAGICPIAIGADGGGSIRIPAAYCGVYGLKTTWGRVSSTGEFPLARSVGNTGPLAGTTRDLALAYMVMSGFDPDDPVTAIGPAPSLRGFNENLTNVRIGIHRAWFHHSDADALPVLEGLLDQLQRFGAELVEIEIPELDELRVAHLITISSEMAAALEPYHRNHPGAFGDETRANLALTRHLTVTDYIKAQQLRTRLMTRVNALFETVDLVATPTTANPAPPLPGGRRRPGSPAVSDARSMSETMRYTVLANMLGNPAITVPAGFTRRDNVGATGYAVPAGLQFIARHWDEALLLRAGRVCEELVERPRPGVWLSPFEE